MERTIKLPRLAAAASLLTTSVLSVISLLLQPEWGTSGVERLEIIDAAGASATVSGVTFVVAQLPFIGAVLAIAHLVRARAPRLAAMGAGLGIVGAFGHAVIGGTALMSLTMAAEDGERDAYGALLDRFESSPFMAFAALGLLGTVLGLLVLAVGMWRADAAPRWVPVGLVAFLVVEFVGTALHRVGGTSVWCSVPGMFRRPRDRRSSPQ